MTLFANKIRKTILRRFENEYLDPSSPIFLEKNIRRIRKFLRRNPSLEPLKIRDIIQFKNELTSLSKDREKRVLR